MPRGCEQHRLPGRRLWLEQAVTAGQAGTIGQAPAIGQAAAIGLAVR
jgi:hypothetical protein